MTAPRVLMLEFNELCPALLDRWIADGSLPNFKALRDQSATFTTIADTPEGPTLEPWIQWVSVHTGLSYDQHGVFHLTDGARAGHDDLWRLLIAAGKRVGSVASMNVTPFEAPGSFFLCDPWTANDDASPPSLNVYDRFVGHQVREYSNAGAALGLGDYARFVTFMLTHGLNAATIAAIARQLVDERLRHPKLSYRRAVLLDRLQFHVFEALWRRHRPDFASFFINSTAHLQHSYWRHMEPEAFSVRPVDAEIDLYGDAIKFGYQSMDRIIGKFLKLAEASRARIVFMTALSQQPFTRLDAIGGQHFYRLHSVDALFEQLGIAFVSADPVMTHQYTVRFENAELCAIAKKRLLTFKVENGRRVFDISDREGADAKSLYFGCQIAAQTPSETAVIDGHSGERRTFGSLLYPIDAIKSGCHHPEGVLWITGASGVRQSPVSILDVFPTVLNWFGVASPADRTGQILAA